jgi:hypothetical protein
VQILEFEVNIDGQFFKCVRFIEGLETLQQIVTVFGLGTKDDPRLYGDRYYPAYKMELGAKRIAAEIINDFENTTR